MASPVLGGLDDKSKEFIAHYRNIASKLKKRFLKKPDAHSASEDYGKLANAMKNDEIHEYAALCFTAMAKCDQVINDGGGEAEAWANAARQFFLAEERVRKARNQSYQEMMEAGVHCYLLAIQVLERQGDNLLAASFCVEAGRKMVSFEVFSQAAIFLQHAVDLQQQTQEWRLDTLMELASCRIRLREYGMGLNTLTQVCTECEGRDGPHAALAKKCEVSVLLLLLLLQPNKRSLSAGSCSILEKYSKSPPLDGCGSLSALLHSLVLSVHEGDYDGVRSTAVELRPLLSIDQQHLLHLLTELHSMHHAVL